MPHKSSSSCQFTKHLLGAYCVIGASQMALVVKKLLASAGRLRDTGLIPVSGRSPGGGPSNPLQYSCLENLMDRGAWQAAVQRVAQNHARLSNLACMHAQCDRHPARFYVKRGVLEKQTV